MCDSIDNIELDMNIALDCYLLGENEELLDDVAESHYADSTPINPSEGRT